MSSFTGTQSESGLGARIMGSKQGQFSLLGTLYDLSAYDVTRFICWLTVPKNLLELKAKFKLMLQSF